MIRPFLILALFATPALAQDNTQTASTVTPQAYVQMLTTREAQHLAAQQAQLQAACVAARTKGTTLPAGC